MERLRVLMVEDNPADAFLLECLLGESPEGTARMDLSDCSSIVEAARRLEDEEFDCVLLDLSLPDSHGPGTISKVRSVAPHVAVVVLTGSDDMRAACRAVHDGAQDYLVKGQVTGAWLARAISYAVERQQRRDAVTP